MNLLVAEISSVEHKLLAMSNTKKFTDAEVIEWHSLNKRLSKLWNKKLKLQDTSDAAKVYLHNWTNN